MRAPRTDGHPTRMAAKLGIASWLVVVALLTPPQVFRDLTESLDDSWYLGVVLGFERHLQWGRDVVFSYGPLGFLSKPIYVDERTWLLSFAAAVAAHVVFLAVMAWLLVACRARGRYWLLVTAVLLLPAPALPSVEHELVLAAFALLLVAERRAPARAALVAAGSAGALVALLAVIKGTALLSGATLILVFGGFAVSRRLRLPAAVAAMSSVVTLAVLWIAVGQHLSTFPAYVRGEVEVIGGYSAAMGVDGLDYYGYRYVTQQAIVGFSLVCAAGVAAGYAAWRADFVVFRQLALAVPLLFVDFKEGFVRFGNNQSVFYSMFAIVSTILLVAYGARRDDAEQRQPPRGPRLLAIGAIAAAYAVLTGPGFALHLTHFPPAWPGATLGERYGQFRVAAGMITSPSARAARAEAAVGTLRHSFALTDAEIGAMRGGTVDAAPWDISVTQAYGLPWRPRFAMQSYAAYTPYLDHADAAAWRSPSRPAAIFYFFAGIDRRYPPWEEPATFRALLETYQPAAFNGPSTVLVPRGEAVTFVDHSVSTTVAPIGSEIKVPVATGGLEYADLEVRQTPVGRLVGLLYKPAPVWVELAYDGHRRHARHRLVYRNAADGLLVSQYLEDGGNLRAIWEGKPGHSIDSLTVTVDDQLEYSRDLHVRFYERTAAP